MKLNAVTIADCPIARARVDSSLIACKLHRELGLDVIPHMTCRDRNINATKALLFGLQIEGIRNVLVVTGDPIPSEDRQEVKGVFNFNSQILAGYIRDLPIVSHRNAVYMNNEISGIEVDEEIVAMYEGTTRKEAQKLAVDISCKTMDEMRPYIDGYYLITPFNRVEIIADMITYIHKQ